ncbi:hypothetical protein [Paenibacillus sp. RC67]|uniref:hypothetical protein n=1 Tax=Paenibacillus sp. RC67 TaxID=3039392 RepID=UPI0024ADCCA9|nr:hypothetical protein [Paenibacillus sp. RC67]
MLRQHALNRVLTLILIFALVFSLFNLSFIPTSTVHAAPGDSTGLLDVQVNKPVNAVVNLNNATIDISLPYGALYQALNLTIDPGASAALYRSDEKTAIPFNFNKNDAKLDQFSTGGPTNYYLVLTDKNNSDNKKNIPSR